MRETRQTVLEIIKKSRHATVTQLAQEIGISPVTVRHHLYTLMADDLVERAPRRRGVGRPEHEYTLTETGQRQFPNRYHMLSAHLLTVLKNNQPAEDVRALMENTLRQMFDIPEQPVARTPQERLRQVQTYLRANDIPIRVEISDKKHAALEVSCPYYHISQQHPELCGIDEKVIRDLLQMPMIRTGCLRDGDKSCTFSIELVENSSLEVSDSGSKKP